MQLKSPIQWLMLALGLCVLATTALASEIYRYTDENGTVRYTDRPTGEPDGERVAIVSRPTDERYSQREAPGSADSADDGADDDEDRPLTRAERRAAEAQRVQDCERYKYQLERLETSRRVYREDENGERVFFDDEQIIQLRDEARQRVEETCR